MSESKFKIEFMSEEQKEAFIVLSKEYMENLELKINCKDTPCMFALENYYIKEDKMEEIRVVRKLEDLDGLENGMGLKVVYENDKERVVTRLIKGHKTAISWFTSNDVVNFGLEYILSVIKAMGFKFEYKPTRTEQEVKKEIMSLESLPFTQEKVNYYVDYNSLINKYLVICDSVNGHGLHIYMTEEQAQKYADELNEIIGVGK